MSGLDSGLGPPFVLLQAAPAGPDYSFFVMMGLIFLIFYFLVLRPQQKRQKDHEEMLKGVERGDMVITSGGLHGRVIAIEDDFLTLEIASLKGGDHVRVHVSRGRLDSVRKGAGAPVAKPAGKGKAGRGKGGGA